MQASQQKEEKEQFKYDESKSEEQCIRNMLVPDGIKPFNKDTSIDLNKTPGENFYELANLNNNDDDNINDDNKTDKNNADIKSNSYEAVKPSRRRIIIIPTIIRMKLARTTT